MRTVLFLCLCAATAGAVDIQKAAAYGSQFKSRKQFLEKGLKDQKVQLASAWAKDGISKYVTLFTDFEAVAAASAQAQQEMRSFSPADARKLPLTGLVYGHVEIHGRGDIPVRKVRKRYVEQQAHLVFQFGEDIVQPLSKATKGVRDASPDLPVALFSWWDAGGVSLLTGGTLGWAGAKVEMEFVFRLTADQMRQKGTLILIDGDGNRHKEELDPSKVFKYLSKP